MRSRNRFTCSLCSWRASVSRSKRIPHSHRSRTPGDSLARCCTLDSGVGSDRSCRRFLRRSGHTFHRSPSPRLSFRRRRYCRHRPRLLPHPAPRPAPSLLDSRSAARSLPYPRTIRSRNYYFAGRFDATPSGAAVDCSRGCSTASISSKTVAAVVWSRDDPPDGSCVSRWTRRI